MKCTTTQWHLCDPLVKSQCGFYFFSLDSGKRINWYSWTELPMPVEVDKYLEELAEMG